MTIGAKELAILVVPNGWIAKRMTKIAQLVPMIVASKVSLVQLTSGGSLQVVMLGEATSIPWIAPRTD
jgi:hypothetical protein